MLNDRELAEIEARCEKATPGPWTIDTSEVKPEIHWTASITGQRKNEAGIGDEICWGDHELGEHHITNPDDGEFIAAARTDIPALLNDLRVYKRALWLDFRSMDSNCRSTDAEVQQDINEWIAKAQKELANE